jgi:hypothetical protein
MFLKKDLKKEWITKNYISLKNRYYQLENTSITCLMSITLIKRAP